jgi:hypothetical protein
VANFNKLFQHRLHLQKKTRTHASGAPEGATTLKSTATKTSEVDNEVKENIPRSIVARSGSVVAPLKELVRDLRKLMSPYTATNLREKR